jgi:nitrite reductase/ring-hydroxylating ferredoxin subunit
MDIIHTPFVRVGPLSELRRLGSKVVSSPGGPVLVIADGKDVIALDNRCPYMGFPLHRGSIEDGILTCHWHHARFDLRTGCTFDLWADDVPTRAVRIVDGEVSVAAHAEPRDEAGHWRHVWAMVLPIISGSSLPRRSSERAQQACPRPTSSDRQCCSAHAIARNGEAASPRSSHWRTCCLDSMTTTEVWR